MLLADLASGMRVSPSTSPLSSARAACVALWRAPGFMPAGLPLQPGANRPPCLRLRCQDRWTYQNLSRSLNGAAPYSSRDRSLGFRRPVCPMGCTPMPQG